ncbi:MAG: ribonuclease Z [Pyrinomonadaceae bacterium]|nr:ribonuclease Z [Pyrinomonadaceae bacterium]
MELTILGSGTTSPHPTRGSSGFWLETARGSIMLDLSATAFHRAAREGFDWANLDAIWISHFHLDHVGGLAPFLFGTKYAFETQARTKTMRIFAPEGLRELLEKFDSAYDYGIFTQPFPLEITEVKADSSFEILPYVKADTYSTQHTPESLALKINDGEKTFVFTSDTGSDAKLGEFAKDCDLLLTESSFVEKSPIPVHIGFPESIELVNIAKPKNAVFTHFYSVWDGVDFKEKTTKYATPCEITEAVDGLRITV